MKYKKMLKRVKELLSGEAQQKKARCKELKRLLKLLKKKEASLCERLEHETSEKQREKLKKRIAVLHAQRKKGLEQLEAMQRCR